jgi:hypothetical protein
MTALKELIHNSYPTPVKAVRVRGIPEDHFVVFTRILGIESFYLLKGEENDMTAEIVGRLESPKNRKNSAYKGNELKGGEFLGSNLWFIEAMEFIVR